MIKSNIFWIFTYFDQEALENRVRQGISEDNIVFHEPHE